MTLWRIKYNLWRLSRRAEPDREFVTALKRRLQPTSAKLGWSLVWKTAGVALVAVCALGLGTTGYVYASDDVLPDHPLYPLREKLEDAELALAPLAGEANLERVQAKVLERRLAGVKGLRARNQKNLPPRAVLAVQHLRAELPVAEKLAVNKPWKNLPQDLRQELALWDGPGATSSDTVATLTQPAASPPPVALQIQKPEPEKSPKPPLARTAPKTRIQRVRSEFEATPQPALFEGVVRLRLEAVKKFLGRQSDQP